LWASLADGVRLMSAAIRTISAGGCMKLTVDQPYSDPEKAARTLVEIANTVEVVQDGRIHIEKINGPFLFREKGTPEEYKAGLDLAIERGWLDLHESGTFVRFAPGGAELSEPLCRHPRADAGRVSGLSERPLDPSRV